MQVFIRIISYILVTSAPLADLMRYPLAGKLCNSDLPLTMCSRSSEKSNSEEVEAIKDTTVIENIYKHAFDMVVRKTRGYKYVSLPSVLFYPQAGVCCQVSDGIVP